jgi:hypothetical protein
LFKRLGLGIFVAYVAVALAGCAAFRDNQVQPVQLTTAGAPSPYEIGGVTTATLLPASNYSLVTSRPNPMSDGPPILCAQPSPDLATAFGETAQAGAAGGGGGVTANVNGSVANTQTITALAGRTAGVVALRDGLYSACEAYANGMIGKDAYALILSQYGNLLVALGSDGGAATEAGTAQLQQEAVQAMLVACITHSDYTTGPRSNPVLDEWCPDFMADFMKAVPALLKPAAVAPPAASKLPTAAAPPAAANSPPLAASQPAPNPKAGGKAPGA